MASLNKILLFTDSLGAGGAQRQLVGLAIMLKDIGYKVKVATYYDIDFYKQALENNGVCHELIPNAENKKKRIWAVRRFFMKEKPDCIIAYQETPSLIACLTRILGCKFKLIVSERNTTQSIGTNERIRFFLYKWVDLIVPNSFTQEKWIKSHYPKLSKKIYTIINFVDLDKFYYVEHERRSVPEILIVATIWPSKNTLGLIEAISLLKKKSIKCHFSWYGIENKYQDYLGKCYQLIKTYNVQDYISLFPKTKDIHLKYQEADYFCLPSFYEGTPNVICEAISTGVPVICSDVCDNHLYVKEGFNGILFNPNNILDITEKIELILQLDETHYKTYRNNCRGLAERLLNKELFIKRYTNIIE
ncbi:MAG: glycosyltransferase [Paludibacteraceae bacterium]|nr:glycosyltransferase [Paludibacteraceae bacterium]